MSDIIARVGMATHLSAYGLAGSALLIGDTWPVEAAFYVWVTSVIMLASLVLFGD